jgi:hypothetical protein
VKKSFRQLHDETDMEMDTVVVVDRIHPCDLGLLDHSLEDNVEVDDHFKIDHSLYVGPLDLVDHLNDLLLGPFLDVNHIGQDLELHHIIVAMTNKSCGLPFPYDPFHRSLLYPFRYVLEVLLVHRVAFLVHMVAFCLHNPYFLLGFVNDLPSFLLVVHTSLDLELLHIEMVVPLVVEHRILLVIRVIEVAYHHSLGFIHILLKVGIY